MSSRMKSKAAAGVAVKPPGRAMQTADVGVPKGASIINDAPDAPPILEFAGSTSNGFVVRHALRADVNVPRWMLFSAFQ